MTTVGARVRVPAFVWAVGDTLVQRGGSAVVLMTLAGLTSPTVVGVIAILTLVLTLYQACVEAPLRQIAFRTLQAGSGGTEFIKRASTTGGFLGSLLLLIIATALILGESMSEEAGRVTLLIFALVPLVTSKSLRRLMECQRDGDWRRIAISRMGATFVSFIAAAGFVVIGVPVAAVPVQAFACEVVFWLLIRPGTPKTAAVVGGTQDVSFFSDFRSTALLSLFGWLRGQGDRLALSIIAGPGALGVYTIGYAFARAGFDGAANGSMNLFRSRLAQGNLSSGSRTNSLFRSQLFLLIVIAGFISGISLVATAILYKLFLGEVWRTSVAIAPMIVASSFACAYTWSMNAYLNHTGQTRKAYKIQWFEIIAGLGVAAVIAWNIYFGIVCLVLRDVLSAIFLAVVAREEIEVRHCLVWGLPCLGSFVLALLSWYLIGGIY